jgi:putative ABC transport system substrate-binding protein
MRRREFIAGLGGAAASSSWVRASYGQRLALPVIALVISRSADTGAEFAAAFRKGLGETGYVDGQNVTVEEHWLAGRFERLPGLMADLVLRRVNVISR